MSSPAMGNGLETVSDLRWGAGASPADRLHARSSAFNFYQAVRLLAILHGDDSNELPVRFRSRMSFSFPAADIDHIEPSSDQFDPVVVVNFLALAGAHGPLPAAYVQQLVRDQKGALRDFLDIFHHRLVSLAYRIHAMHHPELTSVEPSRGLAANFLYALFGLDRDQDSAIRNRLAVPDRALLDYSGLFAQRLHSSAGLERLVADYFDVDVHVEDFVGAWLELSEDQWTRIGGKRGSNHALGSTTVIGRRVWDQHADVMIELGPMNLTTYMSFLPDGDAYRPLCDLVRFYLKDEFDFAFRLILSEDETPVASSGHPAQPDARSAVLGRLAWLQSGRQNGKAHMNGTNGASSKTAVAENRDQ